MKVVLHSKVIGYKRNMRIRAIVSSVLSGRHPDFPVNRVLVQYAVLACLILLFTCTLLSSAEVETAIPMQKGELDFVAAIELARRGDPDKLLHITRMVAKHPNLLPSRKLLNQYHQYLRDDNIFIQYFAVQVLAGLKDKSSAEPLRQFILDVERRRGKNDTRGDIGDKERIAMELASATALAAVGEIDEDSSVTIKFLASRLKHDSPMEWGGGEAHSALAKKGRAGLRILLDEATQPLNNDQERFLRHAISHINDTELAVDLYACCKDPKYHEAARKAALWALGVMAKQSSEIEQLVINIAEDEKSDLRLMAIERLGAIGSSRARSILLEYEKTLPQEAREEARAVQSALLVCDPTNRFPRVIETILSPKTPRDEKEWWWNDLEGKTNEKLLPYEKDLERCLGVCDENGVPINDLRVRVWSRLFSLTKKRYPIELDASNEMLFERVSKEIIWRLVSELNQQYAGRGNYTYAQLKEMASEEAKTLITKWDRQKKTLKP